MSEYRTLLAAVLDEPADDTPRLVLADWLEETGHDAHMARAEFIRLQVAGEREKRQLELLDDWAMDWMPAALLENTGDVAECRKGFRWAVGDRYEVRRCDVAFARGFVSAVVLPGLPRITIDESTGATVADGFTESLLTVFDENPVDRVLIEFREIEDWRIEKRPRTVDGTKYPEPHQWRCRGPNPWGPQLCWGHDRGEFAEQLHASITERIEEQVRLMQLLGPGDEDDSED